MEALSQHYDIHLSQCVTGIMNPHTPSETQNLFSTSSVMMQVHCDLMEHIGISLLVVQWFTHLMSADLGKQTTGLPPP